MEADNHNNGPERELFFLGLTAPFIAVLLGVTYYFVNKNFPLMTQCILSLGYGIYCPGCGGTRAVIALLHGHVLQALWLHPFVPYCAVVYLGFMLTNGLNRIGIKAVKGWRFHYWYLWVGLGIIAVNFVIKNVLRLKFGILM